MDKVKAATIVAFMWVLEASVGFLAVALLVALACWGLGAAFTWGHAVAAWALVVLAALALRLGVGSRD